MNQDFDDLTGSAWFLVDFEKTFSFFTICIGFFSSSNRNLTSFDLKLKDPFLKRSFLKCFAILFNPTNSLENKLLSLSSPFMNLLKKELEALTETGFDLSLLGWGDDVPTFADEPDYGSLDDFDDPTNELANDVFKAIQIEFRPEDYEEAKEVVAQARKKGVYVGQELVNALKALS